MNVKRHKQKIRELIDEAFRAINSLVTYYGSLPGDEEE